jgi:hypothetical protein
LWSPCSGHYPALHPIFHSPAESYVARNIEEYHINHRYTFSMRGFSLICVYEQTVFVTSER